MDFLLRRLLLIVLLLLFWFYSFPIQAQQNSLENYIELGLRNNAVLQQKNRDVKKAWYALKTAESLFMPTISFQTAYQSGAGGRSISLPVGDLMNPVYTTLNQLTGSEKFSIIANVDQAFLPTNFYDAKIRTMLPIFNRDLTYNRRLEAQKFELEKLTVVGYRQELAKNIKVAYYTYFSAVKGIAIYESALALATEQVRTNEKLLQSGKGLPSYVLRATSELESIRSKITEAQKAAENAALYVNFLVNRASNDSIDRAVDWSKELDKAVALLPLTPDSRKRPEVKLAAEALKLQSVMLNLNESFWLPKLNGFVDLGSQAGNFDFNSKSRYYNVGLQLELPLYAGKRNLYKIKQAQLDQEKAKLNLEQTTQQVALTAASAQNNLTAVYQLYQSAVKRVESAASYQRLIERGVQEGVNSFLEDIDARSLLTTAQLQANLALFNVLITAATLERESGLVTY
ncbi:TolC family protein [Spirosoma gilvum]